jgi:hypothetical protein
MVQWGFPEDDCCYVSGSHMENLDVGRIWVWEERIDKGEGKQKTKVKRRNFSLAKSIWMW